MHQPEYVFFVLCQEVVVKVSYPKGKQLGATIIKKTTKICKLYLSGRNVQREVAEYFDIRA